MDLLDHRALHDPDVRPYQVVHQPSFTYAEWARRSNGVAAGLQDRQVAKGDRIGLVFRHPDWDDYAAAYLGLLRVGAVAVHLSADLDPAELERRIGVTNPTALVLGPGVAPPASFQGWTAAVSDVESSTAQPDRNSVALFPQDSADILFTSGTTGPAKAFVNPHGNLSFGEGPSKVGDFDGGAPMLAPMPMGTPSSAGIVGMFALTAPAPIVLCPTNDTETIGRLIEQYRVGTALFVPWIAMQLIIDGLADRYDLQSVSSIAVASGALPSSYARRLLAVMPNASIRTAYAQGEAVPAVLLNSYDPDYPLQVGSPSPVTELQVVRADGSQAGPGQLGEVWLRAPAPKRLYLDDEQNRRTHADGWTRTQDLARLDAEGRLTLFDRMNDAIQTPEALVSSLEVEEVLYQHLSVEQAAVYGVPRGKPDAQIEAKVVAAKDAPVTERELIEFCAERLPAGSVPTRIGFVDGFPRGMTGKLSKAKVAMTPLPAAGSESGVTGGIIP